MQNQCRSLTLLLRTCLRQSSKQQQHMQQQTVRNSFSLALPQLSTSSCSSSYTNKCCTTILPLRTLSKFTPVQPSSLLSDIPGALSHERARELVANLKDSERESLKDALNKFEAIQRKQQYEGKLAATQWRTRFGKMSSVPTLGTVDPTGSYCAFPEDWIKKKLEEKAVIPAAKDLWKIFFVNAVPFLAFGFLDNFIMIVAGDYIEEGLGMFMSISTMAAAGLGNTVSDILGIGSAHYVERGCQLLGLKPPDLTPIQFNLPVSSRFANWGRIIGITVGCILGLSPLLLLRTEKTDEAEHPTQLEAKEKEVVATAETKLKEKVK